MQALERTFGLVGANSLLGLDSSSTPTYSRDDARNRQEVVGIHVNAASTCKEAPASPVKCDII